MWRAALAVAALAPFAGGIRTPQRGGAAQPAPASEGEVRKPLTDKRRYEFATLAENGLKVLAVEDQAAAKAGFAVAVEAGSFYDPVAFPGLAHFCEHLLFLGTAKYPDESSFDNFMALHDGTNNAYTEPEQTVYFNEVSHAGFEEGMDRFAQFFVAPLFKQDLVGRELSAVSSEHEKNKPNQNRRMWEILRRTARPDSVLARFYTGNMESLHHGDASAVAALRAYHDANYCAPRMNLVMVSNLSLAEQLAAARRHFGAVPRGKCGPARDFGQDLPPYGPGQLGHFLHMGTRSTPTLWMMFPVPSTLKSYKEAPTQYLNYALSYAGPRSLKSRLKRRGLITDIQLQVQETSASTLVFLAFDLAPLGAEEAGVREVAGSTFALLRQLRGQGAGDVAQVYASLKAMTEVNFDFLEAPDDVMDAVSALASAMALYAPQDVLTASNGVVDHVDARRVQDLLTAMAEPRNVNIGLAAPGFNDSAAGHFEEYYGIHFDQKPIPQEWLSQWAAMELREELRPMRPLRYVPTELAVLNASAGEHPQRLEARGQTSGPPLELWWKGRGAFALPRAQLRLRLSLPRGQGEDAAHEALRRLHAGLASQVLEEATDDLRSCGLSFEVTQADDGYRLNFDGYDQHLGELVLAVLDGLVEPQFEAAEFQQALRKVTEELSDTTRYMPYQLALESLAALTTASVFGREEVLAELGRVNETGLRSYLAALRAGGLRVQLLVVGNVGREAALNLSARVADSVAGARPGGRLLGMAEAQKTHVLVAREPVEVRMRNPILGDASHATVNAYQYGVADIAERVRMLLLGKMIENPVYDTLRTKKQLGYVVFGFTVDHSSVLELRVLVQGSKELPDDVDGDIEAVLEDFGNNLRSMPQAEFFKWKESVRSTLHRKDQNMGQEADSLWAQVANDGHCFDRKKLALQYLETLQSVDAVARTFDKLRRSRSKVSVKLFGNGTDPAAGAPALGLAGGRNLSVLLGLGDVDTQQKQRLVKAGASNYPTGAVCQASK